MNKTLTVRRFNKWIEEKYAKEMEENGQDAMDYLFSLDRPNHLAIHDAYMVDQFPMYAKLKERLVFANNGWYQCSLCPVEKPHLTETLVAMMSHFEISHKDLNIHNEPTQFGGDDD